MNTMADTKLEPIVKSIEVPCGQEQAFNVFVNEMDTWWPLGKFTTSAMAGAPAKAIRVEAKKGGTITEISGDDTEYLWGTFLEFDPFGSFAMDFHFGPPDQVIEERTRLEVAFTDLGDGKTRVQLTQTGWEGLGEWAADIRGGYDFGWGPIFEEGYKAACSA
ncbi:MAG: hypothetical protein HOB82_04090 [Alphaproteobacteria bacterium]|jgi:hypothetical protein|nr:hypothetical protein [Alphaproteobacteria bacterium]MBT5860468.1 hypothetical protein [Alphaproteobacteria bacterium]